MPYLLYPFICGWTFRLLLRLGYLFTFGRARSSLLAWTVSSHGEWGLLSCWGAGLSLRRLPLLRAQALERPGFSSCGSWAQWLVSQALERALSGCGTEACGIFPDQGSNWCPCGWILIYCATRGVLGYFK